MEAIRNSKHVIVEKPVASKPIRVEKISRCSTQISCKSKSWFQSQNRSSNSEGQAKLIEEGVIGDLTLVRARYGHGARKGYEKKNGDRYRKSLVAGKSWIKEYI